MLKPSGDFVCKYYSGAHDKELEKGVKLAFTKTHITKPPASRQVHMPLLPLPSMIIFTKNRVYRSQESATSWVRGFGKDWIRMHF